MPFMHDTNPYYPQQTRLEGYHAGAARVSVDSLRSAN